MVGHCKQVSEDGMAAAREAYLSSHPGASYYIDFRDFSLWQLNLESIRYIGGYGRMSWVESIDWGGSEPDPIAPMAGKIIDHMNEDHADTMVLYCRAYSRATDTSAATMTAVDRYGFEMSATTGAGPRPIRVAFAEAVSSTAQVRHAMVELARGARVRLEKEAL